MKSWSNTLDDIVSDRKNQIKQLNKISATNKEEDRLGFVNEEWAWVIDKSFEHLQKSYPDQTIILFVLWQFPNGVFDSDFEMIFHEIFPKWKEFIHVLMKYHERFLSDAKVKIEDLNIDEETFWLISSQFIEEVQEYYYTPYPIVYSYINKLLLTPEQKQKWSETALVHLSKLSRKIVRSMKKWEIKILSFMKFTAAIDVGLWSDKGNFSDPAVYLKDYEDLIKEPKLIFIHHETNFQQFLEKDYLASVFPK